MSAEDEGRPSGDTANDRLILLFLGTTAITCIIGLVILAVFKVDAQPLVAIGSGAVGALATKVNRGGDSSGDSKKHHSKDEDDFAILGRAATKSIIAEAMRQMGAKE